MAEQDSDKNLQRKQQPAGDDGCASGARQYSVSQQQYSLLPPHTDSYPPAPTYLHHQQRHPSPGMPVQYPLIHSGQFSTEAAHISHAAPQPQVAAPTPATMGAPLHAAQIGYSAAGFSVDALSAGHGNARPASTEQPESAATTPATATQELVFIPANIDRIKRGYEDKSRKQFTDEVIPRRRSQRDYEVLVFRAKQPRVHRDPVPRIRPATPQSPIGTLASSQRQSIQASDTGIHNPPLPRPPSSASEAGTIKRRHSAVHHKSEPAVSPSKHKLEMLLDDPMALYNPVTYTAKSEAESSSPMTPYSISQSMCAYEGPVLTQPHPGSSSKGKEPEVVCYPPPQPGIQGYPSMGFPEHSAIATQLNGHDDGLLVLEEIAKVRSELDLIETDIHAISAPEKQKLAVSLAHMAQTLSEFRLP